MIVFVSPFASIDRFLNVAHSQTFPPRLWSQLQAKVLTIAETKSKDKPPLMRSPDRPGAADMAADMASRPGAHRPGKRKGCLNSRPGAHHPACVTAKQSEIKIMQRTQLPRAEQITISKDQEQAKLVACTSTWSEPQTLMLWPQTFATMDPPSFS